MVHTVDWQTSVRDSLKHTRNLQGEMSYFNLKLFSKEVDGLGSKVHTNKNFLAPILNFVLFHGKLCLSIKILGKFF